ncbi:hypothetical protein AAEX28_10470 [Lentisphaerota bacterium WC36G]|nr:hypothetical protein LJT99_13315 [Lentisphaerae bacterium WC36]
MSNSEMPVKQRNIEHKILIDTLNLYGFLFKMFGWLTVIIGLLTTASWFVSYPVLRMFGIYQYRYERINVSNICEAIFRLAEKETPVFLVMLVVIALIVGLGGMMINAGSKLKNHQSYVFCMFTAIILCFIVPLGTILGVCAIITLNKFATKELFYEN